MLCFSQGTQSSCSSPYPFRLRGPPQRFVAAERPDERVQYLTLPEAWFMLLLEMPDGRLRGGLVQRQLLAECGTLTRKGYPIAVGGCQGEQQGSQSSSRFGTAGIRDTAVKIPAADHHQERT